jgi:hypothetical protein
MHILERVIADEFGGKITSGQHKPGPAACILEAAHFAMGDKWSDSADHWPDIRPLNDGPWSSDEQRTKHLLPVMVAFWDWDDWPTARQRAVITQINLDTVRQIVANLPDLPHTVRDQCRNATLQTMKNAAETVAEAAWAAWAAAATATAEAAAAVKAVKAATAAWAAAAAAAEAAAAKAAAWAAAEAATAEAEAAWAAAEAATAEAEAATPNGDQVLILACRIWLEAARKEII